MTPQEIFNTAYINVIRQGQRSARDHWDAGCKYRGPNGLKCAVGFMIPDDLAKAWDKRGRNAGVKKVVLSKSTKYPAPDWMKANAALLNEIQCAHDDSGVFNKEDFVVEFEEAMNMIAKRWDLEIPEIPETTEA